MIGLAIAATGYVDFLKAIAQRESSLNPGASNSGGYKGLFQMGTLAMTDAGYYRSNGTGDNTWRGTFTGKNGVTSLNVFMSNPDLQVKAITDYYVKLQGYINYFGLAQHIGKTVNGTAITLSGLIAGAHLVGIGDLKRYLDSGGTFVPKDNNHVPVTQYIAQFGGYAIASAAPTFAEVLAANPTGPSGTATLPNMPGGAAPTSPIFTPGPVFSSPDAGYAAASGYAMVEMAEFFRTLLAAVLFLWGGYIFVGAYRGYAAGKGGLVAVGKVQIRVFIVLLVLIALLR
jgi:integrating conjugative element protein (TIGR03758 family)